MSRGLVVGHLTDQHVGRITPMAAQHHAVDLLNLQCPDVVMLTGDFIAHSLDYLDALYEVLVRIDAPAFAVLGNHDHWSGPNEVRRVLARAGVEILDNANTVITVHRERLQVVGVDDSYTGHHDVAAACKGLDFSLPTIGLSHIAEEADEMWERGVPLVFSGHTHAGQITWAKLHEWSIGKLAGHKYVHGLYGSRRDSGAVYVGAGIGASVMPIRLGDRGRREVTLFSLGEDVNVDEEHHQEQSAHEGRAPTEKKKAQRQKKVLSRKKQREKMSKSSKS
ncbi:MAG: phosphatase [Deltaproteobacteria bacterium]|nr:phosphatase [Deltaproteobacteria bacterium]